MFKKIYAAYKLGRVILDNLTELEDFDIKYGDYGISKSSNYIPQVEGTLHTIDYTYDKKGTDMIKEYSVLKH